MNFDKRKKKLLFSVKTASSLAGLIIVSGYLLIVLSAAVGTLLFQSDISGNSVHAMLNTFVPDSEQRMIVQGKFQNTATSLEAIKTSINSEDLKLSISNFITSLELNSLWILLAAAFLTLWSGYMLRVMSILAETQLIDYQSAS